MQKILPFLWFDKQAKEATALYTSLFPNSKVASINTIKDTPSGDCDIVEFSLMGKPFTAISAGPYYQFNPAISFFVTFSSETEIEKVWDKLIDGGKALMPFQTYPWAKKYGWLQDKYGLSWQLSFSDGAEASESITPLLMFTKQFAGKAKEAIEFYTHTFPNSKSVMQVPYEKNDGDVVGYLKHARFSLGGTDFMAMDSSGPHEFVFSEAISLLVICDTQEEIDAYWAKLSTVPDSGQCGWCKDAFGVTWQIVPKQLNELMSQGTPEQSQRVTQAYMKMKKFDIAKLQEAFDGEG